jgi:hypothetical protein
MKIIDEECWIVDVDEECWIIDKKRPLSGIKYILFYTIIYIIKWSIQIIFLHLLSLSDL